ncbi:hypothetical protein HQ865_01230 [Mucilaginibacter mali]|uniref:Uncharacterized protein n=1 Tax=Mucilaginibacter mali TaxID=2740462 RepID=A0A7D4TVB5_9SPHI|nr:hypothetical protein [Mucilaginibacter mali]QKJ28437.1 hypothetical protein HQ865_01230 [Mucilaginibacter mali]
MIFNVIGQHISQTTKSTHVTLESAPACNCNRRRFRDDIDEEPAATLTLSLDANPEIKFAPGKKYIITVTEAI